ncbi:acetyl-CoA C-acyltransferase [Naasia lichenicola]|uniref:Probable acetyl-CoA acetyltransferase n=1 Tax=Naasia lichenicola TaxID=2565933 RepID=A0A4S4FI97_9MICO|nr:acetyl-CoA C-acyltransferase [Naasia lichenicola]THG29831.1 acetyl-CoA C-acyltransferase [Naasia lichenicola]
MTVVLAGYARTPFSKFVGRFAGVSSVQLGTHAVTAALTRAGVDGADVERVFGGQVLLGGAGQNPTRQTAVASGIPLSVPATTINIVCLSGMEAVVAAARLIDAGEIDIAVAFGQESMTNAPHAWIGSRVGKKYGAVEMVDLLDHDGLLDSFDHLPMGANTETGNGRLGIGRAEQDAWAALSHQRAAASAAWLADEIEPFPVTTRKGTVLISDDDGIRADTTAESLAGLRPAFAKENGTITAGNASQITDGAAAVVLMSAETAATRGIAPLAEIVAHGLVAGPDTTLHSQPSNAILKALAKTDLTPADLLAVEINEAFASVALHSASQLGISGDIVNVHGGAIALGHPIGASGARVIGTLARQLQELGAGSIGAAALCGGGGQGSAVILRAL